MFTANINVSSTSRYFDCD